MTLRSLTRAMRRSESGTAAVEFAVALPVLLVCFGSIVEASRIYWNFQAAVNGVRDATRYVARVTPVAVCSDKAATQDEAGGQKYKYSFTGTLAVPNSNTSGTHTAVASAIVNRNVRDDVKGQLPAYVSVTSVAASYGCFANSATPYNVNPAPIAQVSATITIDLPFASLFQIVGNSTGAITTTVSDQQRIYGT